MLEVNPLLLQMDLEAILILHVVNLETMDYAIGHPC